MTKSEHHKEEIIQKYDNKNKFHNTKINSANKKFATAMQILYCPFLFLLAWCIAYKTLVVVLFDFIFKYYV